jgi:hypothetical protein
LATRHSFALSFRCFTHSGFLARFLIPAS